MKEQSAGRRALEEMKQQAAETGEPAHDTVVEFQAKALKEEHKYRKALQNLRTALRSGCFSTEAVKDIDTALDGMDETTPAERQRREG